MTRREKKSKEGEGPRNMYLVDIYHLTTMGQSLL